MSLLSKANEPQEHTPSRPGRTRTPEAPGVRKTSRTRSRLMVMHGTTAWTWKTRLGEKHLDPDGSLCRYSGSVHPDEHSRRCEWVSSREPPRRRWKLAVHPECRLGTRSECHPELGRYPDHPRSRLRGDQGRPQDGPWGQDHAAPAGVGR